MVTTWQKVAKPTGTSWTKVINIGEELGGNAIGLLLALTYAGKTFTTPWTKVTKASGTSWTKVPKGT